MHCFFPSGCWGDTSLGDCYNPQVIHAGNYNHLELWEGCATSGLRDGHLTNHSFFEISLQLWTNFLFEDLITETTLGTGFCS